METPTLVILLTNSLGLESENNTKLADLYAQRLNTRVVMPDLFNGDSASAAVESEDDNGQAVSTSDSTLASTSLLSSVKGFVASTVKGFLDDMWAARHSYSHTWPALTATVDELVSIYKPKQIALVGYSFGAKYVLHLVSKEYTQTESGSKVVCGAVIHPSLLEPTDFQNVTKPIHLVYAKDDELLPESLVRKCLEVLGNNQETVEFEKSVYDNHEGQVENQVLPLPHGFAVPGDYSVQIVGDRPQQVLSTICSWIREHL